MATITKRRLSGSVNGKLVKITTNASPGDIIHTAVAGALDADNYDEIWIWAQNSDTAVRKLTVEWGGLVAPDDSIESFVPAEAGPMLVVPGWPLQNSLVVRAFASVVNVVVIGGFVNRVAA